jgi:hypothetical protein
VKHRSPLVTLAGLVLAFAIMFGLNLANSSRHVTSGAPPAAGAYQTRGGGDSTGWTGVSVDGESLGAQPVSGDQDV